MKKFGLITMATALVALLGVAQVVRAQALPVLTTFDINSSSTGPFTFTVNTNTNTFTFSDPDLTFYSVGALNPGQVAVTGSGTVDGAGDILSGTENFTGAGGWTLIPTLTLNSGSFNDFNNQEGGYLGPAKSSGDIDLFSGFYELNIAGSTANGTFSKTGGIYTATYSKVGGYWVPAPETASVVAFGAMLCAGALMLFVSKRRTSTTI
jgi:hypothetical protein